MTHYSKEKESRRGSAKETKIDLGRNAKTRRHSHHGSAENHTIHETNNGEIKRPIPNQEYAYVNPAYVGSHTSVNQLSRTMAPTGVVREQYWACTRWPKGQKFLALAVGVLVGAVVGLAITLVLRQVGADTPVGELIRS